MIRVGIINVTGYAGAELARLLYSHPEAQLVSVSGRSAAGKPLADVFPHLACYDLTIGEEIGDVDFVFSALPHAASAEACAPLVRAGVPVVDISADFRLRDAEGVRRVVRRRAPRAGPAPAGRVWADGTEPRGGATVEANREPGLLSRRVRCSRWRRRSRRDHRPGNHRRLEVGHFGRRARPRPEVPLRRGGRERGGVRALGHRHLPEIVQELATMWPQAEAPCIAAAESYVHAAPHPDDARDSIDVLRAAHASPLSTEAALRELYARFLRGEPFVRVVDSPPATKQTRGSNMCLVYPTVDVRTDRLVVVSVLDNLVKGAAGQAIQNMNAMLGLPETMGLDAPAVYP